MQGEMKAIVYYGENDIRFENRKVPKIIQSTDAIIKLTKTTICGTDLGIWKGKNPEIKETAINKDGCFNGRILGHEGIGIIENVGEAVKNFKQGDKVIISCISRCGTCENCQKQLYSHCMNHGGWIMGYMIDGTQAEYVRTPFADTSLYLLPENLNDDVAVMLSDALPTAHEIGVQNGDIKPGDTVAIVGAGPVGIGCVLTAQLYSPSQIIVIDIDENRLSMSKELGATHIINSNKDDPTQKVLELTQARGVDCAIEAVGIESTWNICQNIVKEGGHLANVGVHGKPVNFSIEKLWIKNLTITTGLVNANTTNMLMKTCCSNKLPIEKMITHHFRFKEIEKAYDVFKHAADEKAMKVIIDY
ncbi:zinc-dependent alcohol dehydrogenase family protein [Candidatus Arsenophonus triatominarum]|uniref:zinc-dependent alcohol dehydrogenase family protein n=1 Tax=Candidatus Arsenophonus triatominarum TaxID=57911 RepID=UPI0007C51150|nr:zinc-dependent alcohol dehydrogenase family protein [Candidatus Arsenophonus triatominarum]